MPLAKVQFLITISCLVGFSMFSTSCKSLAKAHADSSERGGKEPISNPNPRKLSSSPKSKPPNSKKRTTGKTKVKTTQPTSPQLAKTSSDEIVDEPILIENDIPQIEEAKEHTVPGVEELLPVAGPIKVKENSANRIINAGGEDVIISGDDGVIVITGGCGKLTLKGQKNQVQCDAVSQIDIAGNENTLILGSVGGGTIRGDRNNLTWGSGLDGLSPIVQSFGSDNSMKRLE